MHCSRLTIHPTQPTTKEHIEEVLRVDFIAAEASRIHLRSTTSRSLREGGH